MEASFLIIIVTQLLLQLSYVTKLHTDLASKNILNVWIIQVFDYLKVFHISYNSS